MMYDTTIFISHSWNYSTHYDKLCEWIFDLPWYVNGTRLSFRDESVPKDDPIHHAPTTQALRDAILRRIEISDIVIVPTGMYSTYSKWIGIEIEGATTKGKPILGVNPWGQLRRSSIVAEAAEKVVGWNSKSVIEGIWGLRQS